jgi:hypothetical protein
VWNLFLDAYSQTDALIRTITDPGTLSLSLSLSLLPSFPPSLYHYIKKESVNETLRDLIGSTVEER